MNPYIEQFIANQELAPISPYEELELIYHILSSSKFTDLDDFVQAHISYEDALGIVQSDDQFTADAQYWIDNQPDLS